MMGKFPTVYFTLFYSVFRIHMFFFPPGSGSTSQRYGSGSGSFYPIVRSMDPSIRIRIHPKCNRSGTLVLFHLCTVLYFLVSSGGDPQYAHVFPGSGSISRWYRSGSAPKCHGSLTLLGSLCVVGQFYHCCGSGSISFYHNPEIDIFF